MLIGKAEAPLIPDGIAAPQRHDVWAKADPIHRSANALIRVWLLPVSFSVPSMIGWEVPRTERRPSPRESYDSVLPLFLFGESASTNPVSANAAPPTPIAAAPKASVS